MDSLQLVSMPPRNTSRDDRPKARRGPQPDPPLSIKTCTRNFLETGAWHQSQNKIVNEVTRSNEFYDYPSCQSSVIYPDFYASTPKGCNVSLCEASIDTSNVEKCAKKKYRQKTRRKGKQNKRVSSDTGSTESEVLSEHAHESSTSEACSCSDHGGEIISSSTSEVSFPDGSSNQIDLEGDTRFSISEAQVICTPNIDEVATVETFEALDVSPANGCSDQIAFEGDPRFSNSEALTICTSNIEEVATVEGIIASIAQNFPGELPMINPEITIQTKGERLLSISDIVVKGSSQISCYDDLQSKDFSYAPDSSLELDYVSIGSNSDDGHHAKPFHKASSRGNILEAPGFNCRKGSLSHRDSLKGVVDTYHHTGGSKHVGQNFGSSDTQLLLSGKKSKQINPFPRNASAHKYGGFGNLLSRTGKENNHSVWKKVQRNDVDECSTETKISPVCFQSDMSSKEAPSLNRNCIVAEINTSSRTEDKKLPEDTVSKKLKRNNNLSSKQEHSCHVSGCNSNKTSFNTCAKSGMQQNETYDITGEVDDIGGGKSISRTHFVNSCLTAGFQNSGVECMNLVTVSSSQVFPEALQPLQSTHDTVSSTRHFHAENQGNSPARLCNSLDQNVLKVPAPVYLPHLFFNEGPQMETKITLAECCKQNHSSGTVMQKWIPIGVRDSELATSARFGDSLPDPSDGPAGEDFTLRNVQENTSFDSQDLVSSSMLGTCQGSGNSICSSETDYHSKKLQNSTGWMLELNKKRVAAGNPTSESSDQLFSAFGDKSITIMQAVKDACRVQMECEAIQMATGSPVAEFERFLHFSSPAICQLPSLSCCRTCLCDRPVGAPLCRHETPSIPLGCLWKWYEEHGNYGLEVRAEDFENSKNWGLDCFSFRGYFVPFLSAVQLFKNHTSQPIHNKEAPDRGTFGTHESSESSEDSKIGRLPIFSVLIPQPRSIAVSQSVDVTCSNDAELLFEYFESEQPQQRRPLYGKIQELVGGNTTSRCKMYGDPTNLSSLNLRDLHPKSWYSVAWYPIYRIPDGNFRTAFLTYHSLGRLVHGSAKFDSPSKNACVISPVVGLQSYNAQGESWFRLRHSVDQTTGTPSLNHSVILKERVRTLAETASLMARAVVNKGNLTSVNRHPDYEFFLSRRGNSLL